MGYSLQYNEKEEGEIPTCILFSKRKTQKPQQIVRMAVDRSVAIVFKKKNKQPLVKVQCTAFVGSAVMAHSFDKLTMCCRNCMPHFWVVSGRTVISLAVSDST
jgi:hypothetical protein